MGNDRNSDCLSYILCTIISLENNSYVLRYIFIEQQENKNGGKKERRKERKKGPKQDSNPAPMARCDLTY